VLRVGKLVREVTPLLDQSLDVVAVAERIVSPCPDLSVLGVDVDQHLLRHQARPPPPRQELSELWAQSLAIDDSVVAAGVPCGPDEAAR